MRGPQYFFLEKLNLKRSQNYLYTLKGLILAGINFRGSYFRGTFFRDFAKIRENKFLKNAQNRGSRESQFRKIAHFFKYTLQKIVKVIHKLKNLEKYIKIPNSFTSREN